MFFLVPIFLSGCATTLAALDMAGSAVVYTGKTTVRTLDALTPNVVN